MADDADLFDNDAEGNIYFLNFFKDSEEEIDWDGSDIIDLINITKLLPEIEIDQMEKDIFTKRLWMRHCR